MIEFEQPPWTQKALCLQTAEVLTSTLQLAVEEGRAPEGILDTRTSKYAKAICDLCEVREECLKYALEHDERFGIWGGKTEQERYQFAKNPQED